VVRLPEAVDARLGHSEPTSTPEAVMAPGEGAPGATAVQAATVERSTSSSEPVPPSSPRTVSRRSASPLRTQVCRSARWTSTTWADSASTNASMKRVLSSSASASASPSKRWRNSSLQACQNAIGAIR
jgi:hypothetical protein